MWDLAAVRPYLEMAYFVSGILVLIGVFLAYRQLNLLRLDINLRNERAAKEKAIAACERYLNLYVPKCGALLLERQGAKLPDYEGPIGNFTSSALSRKWRDGAAKKLLLESCLPTLNELEAIAASFRSGVADEQAGFQIIGRTFCATVEDHYDMIAFCRDGQPHNYWSSVVALYAIWRPRLTKAEMEQAKNLLERRITSIEGGEIHPIGVNRA